MQKISRLSKAKALTLVVLLGLVSSCASQQSDQPPQEPVSEAALLDDSEVAATPVADDSAIFADLNGAPADSDIAASTQPTAAEASADSSSPFYNPVGGESLGRVAYTLFGSRKQKSLLVEKNPSLSGVGQLSSDQKVYFDFAQVRPMPTYLTKDLIDRYPGELAAKIEETSGLGKSSATLGSGETLQELSMRLYGTTRYWTEIYLLNRDKISNYDRVPAGLSLNVYERAPVAATPAAPQAEAAATMAQPQNEVPAQPEASAAAPAPEAVAQAPVDPIPETPDFNAPAQPSEVSHVPPPSVEAMPATNTATSMASSAKSLIDLHNSANVRRIIYVALILLIGAIAFYMTRTPKKKEFDMLDVTTADTANSRSKLKAQDSQHQEIG